MVVVHACTGWMVVATRMAGMVTVGEGRRGFEFVELRPDYSRPRRPVATLPK